jgi:hypothetical protein
MGWIYPHKRTSKSKNGLFSKYKDVVQSEYFKLQRCKTSASKESKRPPFRIVTKGEYPFYEVAYGDELEAFKHKEWTYILKELEEKKGGDLRRMNPGSRMEWFKNHFGKLADSKVAPQMSMFSDDDSPSKAPQSPTPLTPHPQPFIRSSHTASNSKNTHKKGGTKSMKFGVFVLGAGGVYLNLYTDDWWVRFGLAVFAWLFALSCYSTAVACLFFKLNLNWQGVVRMLCSTDKKWNKKKVPNPDLIKKVKDKRTKRLIFIRHGESEWNLIFNKGVVMLLPRLIKAWIREAFMLFNTNSIFFDSPLNKEGLEQAGALSHWLAKSDQNHDSAAVAEATTLLNGDGEDTVIVSSPLRRAVETTTIGLRRRLKEKGETIKILSSLSEISFNVDTIALADAPHSLPPLTSLIKFCANDTSMRFSVVPNKLFDATDHFGQKPVRGNGLTRLMEFSKWCFGRDEGTIIAGGHSLYFRDFFRTFLPPDFQHPLKVSKIPNSGIVMLTLEEGKYQGQTIYRIVPESIVEIYTPPSTKKTKKL